MITVAIDAMGGDHGIDIVVPSALNAVKNSNELKVILVGDRTKIEPKLDLVQRDLGDQISIEHTDEVIKMDDSVSSALRSKRNSSMHKMVDLLRANKADAAVSAGNTGALMAVSRLKLRTLEGIDRPAIISPLPTISGHTYVLDLGANVGSTAEQLYQFAVMGAVLAQAIDGNSEPSIGLLNIGEEEIKGNDIIRYAGKLLAESHLNYKGFVEADTMFKGSVDVVVCDGFVGNVALKASEGTAKLLASFAKEEFERNWCSKVTGLFARSVLKKLKRRLDPREYNGAILIGLPSIVVKSHGGADSQAFGNAINVAIKAAQNRITDRIAEFLLTSLNGA